MKKLSLIVLACMACSVVAVSAQQKTTQQQVVTQKQTSSSSKDIRISFNDLPSTAQKFLKTYFSINNPMSAAIEKDTKDNEYKVDFSNGYQVEFDKKGNWTEVDCGRSAVPSGIIPTQIQQVVKMKFPKTQIVKIEVDNKGYEVELSNGVDLDFDKKYNLTKIDD